MPAAGAAPAAEPWLGEVEELIDAGRPEAALARLAARAGDAAPSARGLLLRSTARFMLGETAAGVADLDRALELDPSLRQGWLNRAAFELSEGRLDAALAAFRRARELDPAAPDSGLNIGAVLLMKGELEAARTSFESYLAAQPGSAEASYLVATNYGLAGHGEPAVEHLSAAISIDEKIRLRARTDPNFAGLAGDPGFQRLLEHDAYTPPADHRRANHTFDVPYRGGESDLLSAVLDALQLSGRTFDRRVEATAEWALIWGDFRIRIDNDAEGRGVVSLSAPPERFSESQWEPTTASLFRQIALQLRKRGQAVR